RNLVDFLRRQSRAAEGYHLRHKHFVLPREVPDETHSGTRIILREGKKQRPLKAVAHALELSALDRPTSQRVLHHSQIYTRAASLRTQTRHLRHRQPAILCSDDRLRVRGDRIDLRDQRLLVIESERHEFLLA